MKTINPPSPNITHFYTVTVRVYTYFESVISDVKAESAADAGKIALLMAKNGKLDFEDGPFSLGSAMIESSRLQEGREKLDED